MLRLLRNSQSLIFAPFLPTCFRMFTRRALWRGFVGDAICRQGVVKKSAKPCVAPTFCFAEASQSEAVGGRQVWGGSGRLSSVICHPSSILFNCLTNGLQSAFWTRFGAFWYVFRVFWYVFRVFWSVLRVFWCVLRVFWGSIPNKILPLTTYLLITPSGNGSLQ
jgi:hypothetical protein